MGDAVNVADFLLGGSAWWVLPCSLLTVGATFGLIPGLMLRLIVLLYPKGHPRRDELFGELYDPEMGRFERFEWVFQQLETAIRQGPAARRKLRSEGSFDEDGHAERSLASVESSKITSAKEQNGHPLGVKSSGGLRVGRGYLIDGRTGERVSHFCDHPFPEESDS